MTEQKKSTNGRLINVSIDRRRRILFSILFKAIGMSLTSEILKIRKIQPI